VTLPSFPVSTNIPQPPVLSSPTAGRLIISARSQCKLLSPCLCGIHRGGELISRRRQS
jgi:hypothetical protein